MSAEDNKPRPGVLIYRCIRCGREEREAHVRDSDRTVYLATHVRGPVQDWDEAYSGHTSHLCKPGQIGVIELIGADLDEGSEGPP